VYKVLFLKIEGKSKPVGKEACWITLGKQKEGIGYDFYTPGSQLFFTERGSCATSPIRQRNIGIYISTTVPNQRQIYENSSDTHFSSWHYQNGYRPGTFGTVAAYEYH